MDAAWNATIGFGDSCTDYQIIVDVRLTAIAYFEFFQFSNAQFVI